MKYELQIDMDSVIYIQMIPGVDVFVQTLFNGGILFTFMFFITR